MRKRRGYFFIAFISAAITFGSLTAFVNPHYSGMRYGDYGWHHYYERRNPYWNYPPPDYMNPDSVYRNDHQPDNFRHQ